MQRREEVISAATLRLSRPPDTRRARVNRAAFYLRRAIVAVSLRASAIPVIVVRALRSVFLLLALWPIGAMAVEMSADEVIADGCSTTPENFVLTSSWDNKMGLLTAWCRRPVIAQATIPGKRKPQAFAAATNDSNHDNYAISLLNGDGTTGNFKPLGTAPRTTLTLDNFCADATPLQTLAAPGDVVFSLHGSSIECNFVSASLPTLAIVGVSNDVAFVGDTPINDGILISNGPNYGRAIDYFMQDSLLSFALPKFAGVVVALNAALIDGGHAALNLAEMKQVLDDSSDEVWMEVDGVRSVYKESAVDGVLAEHPSARYLGQLVNLTQAIDNELGPPPQLTLVKVVNNDNGGDAVDADFTLMANGRVFESGVAQIMAVGSYDLSETGPAGYVSSDWVCSGGNQVDADTVELVNGDVVTCTVSNDDIAPLLTIVKEVLYENGGTAVPGDFILHISGGVYDGSVDRFSAEPPLTIDANTYYYLSEEVLPGYSRTGIRCSDDNTSQKAPYPVYANEGQELTCTITNIDRPTDNSSFYLLPLPGGGASVFGL